MEEERESYVFYPAGAYDDIAPDSWLQHYLTDGYPIYSVTLDDLDISTVESRVQKLMKDQDLSDGFCSRCQYLLSHWPALDTGRDCDQALDTSRDCDHAVGQTYSTEEIEASSRCGCKLCAFIWSRLQLSGHVDTFRKIEARLRAIEHPAQCALSIQNWRLGNDSQGPRSQFLWLNFPGKEEHHCNSPAAQLVSFNSFSLPIFSKVWGARMDPLELSKSWLSNCRTSHEGCRPLRKYKRPRRLISVSNDTVRLVETEIWEHMPEYATLSYCWGQVPFLKLTRETFSSFLAGIPFESLPRTFQDAICLARELGLEFIWIDALCIIQNEENHTDWLRESGRMDSIYGGSQITLAASSACSAFEGFSPTSTPKYSGGFVARVQTDKSSRVQNFHSQEVHREATVDTHLGSRGWTLQEKLLSPRTIHIGDYGLYWECRSSKKSEFIPEGFTKIAISELGICSEDEEWDWRDVVNTYSRMKLTVGSDRLPALAGIAARQHELTGDQYLAGLWKKELLEMLLWHCVPPVAKRPTWRAPTWSWVSINSACIITYECSHEEMKPQALVLDAWTKTVSDDPFGGVVDGEITLACTALISVNLNRTDVEECWEDMLLYCDLEYEKQLPHLIFPGHQSSPLSVYLDCLDEEMQAKEEQVILLPLFEGFTGGAMECGEPSDNEMDIDDEVKSMDETIDSGPDNEERDSNEEHLPDPAVEENLDSNGYPEGWKREFVVTGIVLRQRLDAPGHYTRLGQFYFTNQPLETERNLYEEFDGFRKEAGEAAAQSGCIRMISSDEHPEHKYVISLK